MKKNREISFRLFFAMENNNQHYYSEFHTEKNKEKHVDQHVFYLYLYRHVIAYRL